MVAGRPTDYSPEMADRILKKLSEGESVSQICLASDMPNRSTVFLWSATHKEFSDRYLLALKGVGQICVDQLDDALRDMKQGITDPVVGKIEIDTLKWKAGKFYPRMYGDKQQIESKNENTNINVDVPLSEADMEILKRFKFTD